MTSPPCKQQPEIQADLLFQQKSKFLIGQQPDVKMTRSWIQILLHFRSHGETPEIKPHTTLEKTPFTYHIPKMIRQEYAFLSTKR